MTTDTYQPSRKPSFSSTLRALSGLAIAGLAFWALFYFMSLLLAHAPEPIGSRSELLIEGAQKTLSLTVWSGALGLLVGVGLGLSKLSRHRWLRWPADSTVAILRGTPLLVQIMFIYYAVPSLHPSLNMTDFLACVVALSLNVGAYNAEVVRGAILAIPRGQTEAALSLGFTPFQTMFWVILPQSLRVALLPLINNLVALLKDSSLASSVGLLELSLAGNRISSETFQPVPVISTIAFVYFLMTTTITYFAGRIEKFLRIEGGGSSHDPR